MNSVSIILATYNGEKYISEQINSILNNTFTNWILWVFDDGSTDKTISIIEEYVILYPDKIILKRNSKNKGLILNFLEGLQYAANYIDKISNYFMFCDQDDVWMPDKIEKTLKHMQKMENKYGKDSPVAVFTDALVVDENLNTLHSSFYEAGRLNTKKVDLSHIMMENKLIGCTVMLNHPLQLKISKLPNHARFHDWWIALIAAAFGTIGYLPVATISYRQHSNNVVGNQNFLSYVKNRITSLQKQREVLHNTIEQVNEFYQIYGLELPIEKKKEVYIFAHLDNVNWILKRFYILKYGFFKTGILRNIGLLFIL